MKKRHSRQYPHPEMVGTEKYKFKVMNILHSFSIEISLPSYFMQDTKKDAETSTTI